MTMELIGRSRPNGRKATARFVSAVHEAARSLVEDDGFDVALVLSTLAGTAYAISATQVGDRKARAILLETAINPPAVKKVPA